jgi:spore coat protein U-like protein
VAAALLPRPSQATNITQAFVVGVGNKAACVIASTPDVNLGAYDTTGTGDKTGSTTIGVTCNGCIDGNGNNKCNGHNRVFYSISLSSVNNWSLKGSAAGDLIPYRIYQPDGATLWNATSVVGPVQGSNTLQNYVATVKAAQGVNVPVGAYSDTVILTVTY